MSEEERARADRYRFAEDQQRCVIGRAALRMMAGAAGDIAPEAVQLSVGEKGRPELAGDVFSAFGVNVSHSGDWVLCASGPTRSMGVDVEQRRDNINVMDLAASVFSDWERDALAEYAPEQRQHLFFDIWSRKEAFIKADGRGVTFGLDRFDVEFRPEHDAPAGPRIRRIDDTPDPPHWHLRPIDLDPQHAAALAVWRDPDRDPKASEAPPVTAHAVRPPTPEEL